MSDELNKDKPTQGPNGAADRDQTREVPHKGDTSAGAVWSVDGGDNRQPNEPTDSCQPDASAEGDASETDRFQLGSATGAVPAGIISDPRPTNPVEQSGPPLSEAEKSNGGNAAAEIVDDCNHNSTALEKLIDAFAFASHDEFLARGDDAYRWEPEFEPYEAPLTLDLVDRDGGLRISSVEWDGHRPQLTIHAGPVTYRGKSYDIPSLPCGMYEHMSFPTNVSSLSSAQEVFDDVCEVLQLHPYLSGPQRELLAFWCMTTWFADALDFVPCLRISGPRYAADLLFDLLECTCRRAVKIAGIRPAVLKNIPMNELQPTLLIRQNKAGKNATELLDASDQRGYFVVCGGELRTFCFAKCVYSGEEYDSKLNAYGLYLHLAQRAFLPAKPYPKREWIEGIQNKLFTYRCFNFYRVKISQVTSGKFLPDLDVVARRLGAAIVDDLGLQQRVAELLQDQSEQARGDHASVPNTSVVKAVLIHAHKGDQHVYAGHLATTANTISFEQGEPVRLTAERVGHVLKKLGFYTRRIASGGRGLVLDKQTQIRAHELAVEYGVLPDPRECGYCHNLQGQSCQEPM